MAYGLAKTNRFMLSTATVLLGAQADLFGLTNATHSVGMVKNFTLTTEPSFIDLTQGVKNTVVFSVMNGHTARTTAEMYEYTAKNLAYVAQLNGATYTEQTNIETTLSSGVTSNATTIPVTSAAGFTVGDWILVQVGGTEEDATVRKITAITGNDLTINTATTRIWPVLGTTIRRMNKIDVGSKQDQPFMAAMILGQLANGDEIALALPKVRVSSGLNLAFGTGDYGNSPLEFTLFDLVPTDANYAAFGSVPAALLV